MNWTHKMMRFIFKYQRCLVLSLGAVFIVGSLLTVRILYKYRSGAGPVPQADTTDSLMDWMDRMHEERRKVNQEVSEVVFLEKEDQPNKVDNLAQPPPTADSLVTASPNYDAHIFYYGWYGNPKKNGRYLHWNHQYLPHWDAKEAVKWPRGKHFPPGDIGANYYPALGPYSSLDEDIITEHMKQIRMTGIGVLSVSWYPPDQADSEGHPSDKLIPILLNAANKFDLKVCLHIEPYKGRNGRSMRNNIQHVIKEYGRHPAFYKTRRRGKLLPLFYIYDTYLVPNDEWKQLLQPKGQFSLRGTDADAVFIGLAAKEEHLNELHDAAFDGFYTYFAATGFTYGSNRENWKSLAAFAREKDMIFIPSVGPGYIDTRIRPWNAVNSRNRGNGDYYNDGFRHAIAIDAAMLSITSFNEWHEGTQIEAAVPKEADSFRYLSYSPEAADFYLQLTRKWIDKWRNRTGKT